MDQSSKEKDGHREVFIFEDESYRYVNMQKVLEKQGLSLDKLPVTIKILMENVLRNTESSVSVNLLSEWKKHAGKKTILYTPARVLMQDFTGVPAIVDLAAMRDAIVDLGGDPRRINPKCAVDLVIDHSVSVDSYGSAQALGENIQAEMKRNKERYQFLKWGKSSFNNFRVVPPGNGICHQVNLEYLAQVVYVKDYENASTPSWVFPDTLVGTDSHTTMINALGVLGWGVGGIEAEASMLGQALDLVIPEVVGVSLTGELKKGVTATDLVLTLVNILRAHGVVGKFVEFYGEGASNLALSERATISNMAPEFGSTCAFFPVDEETLRYLRTTGRSSRQVDLVAKYCMEQGMWHKPDMSPSVFSDHIEVDLSHIVPCVAGPKRPQDKVVLDALGFATEKAILAQDTPSSLGLSAPVKGSSYTLSHGDVVIAAITSCTNTSNPSVLITAGLMAKKALDLGLEIKPWVKASFAPGSKVVETYLRQLGLLEPLEKLGFYLVGYGCTTCIGNSGPLKAEISQCIDANNLAVSAVLSGNRNFEGRIHPDVSMNWLASPPLVVAYAIAGTTRINLNRDSICKDKSGNRVQMEDIWPDKQLIEEMQNQIVASMFTAQYEDIFKGDQLWEKLVVGDESTYAWQTGSTYIQKPDFFKERPSEAVENIEQAHILVLLGDSITTDHISPAGFIPANSPAGRYLLAKQVHKRDFNSYGSRRGNHHVMIRGTFANIRLKNNCVENLLGGYTMHWPTQEILPIYEASERYRADGTPLVVFAGKEYGTGSSRDWAAKGTMMLGVKAVIAESFERIHRSNLVGMGVLPCQLVSHTLEDLKLSGSERIDIIGVSELRSGNNALELVIEYSSEKKKVPICARLDTEQEHRYYQSRGVLPYVLNEMLADE